ncbi:hypothetical protein N9136_03085 [bacterium]|nr:hypothetical protein [bacterium]
METTRGADERPTDYTRADQEKQRWEILLTKPVFERNIKIS